MSYKPHPGWIPPWQDKAALCAHTCLSENTVDVWVKMGLLPPPRRRGGKLMWKWTEVDRYLENGGAGENQTTENLARKVTDATRKASCAENH